MGAVAPLTTALQPPTNPAVAQETQGTRENRSPSGPLYSTAKGRLSAVAVAGLKNVKISKKFKIEGGDRVTRALKIESLTEIDATSAQILRVISLHLGEETERRVDYQLIADSLHVSRDTVRKAVNRMVKNRTLAKRNGMLSIPGAVIVK